MFTLHFTQYFLLVFWDFTRFCLKRKWFAVCLPFFFEKKMMKVMRKQSEAKQGKAKQSKARQGKAIQVHICRSIDMVTILCVVDFFLCHTMIISETTTTTQQFFVYCVLILAFIGSFGNHFQRYLTRFKYAFIRNFDNNF